MFQIIEKKMTVLWFSSTPANADENFKYQLKGTGGWLKALDLTIQQLMELLVAFIMKAKKALCIKKPHTTR